MPGNRIAPLWLVVAMSVFIALGSYRFLGLGLDLAFPGMPHQLLNAKAAFLAHIIASPIALFCGGFQFFRGLRQRYPVLHRWNGRLYVLAIVVGSVSGFVIALEVPGAVGAVGFMLLASVWLVSAGLGWQRARAGRFAEHRRWMIRAFALTFAGVTLRVQLFGFFLAGSGYDVVYPFLAWSCWLPNMLFAEWWIRRQPEPVHQGA